MASKEKVQEFLNISKEYVIASRQQHLFCDEDEINIEIAKRVNALTQDKVIDFINELYQEILTDKEVDELIAIYSSTLFKKVAERTPEINAKLSDIIEQLSENLDEEIDRITEEVRSEFSERTNQLSGNESPE